LTLTNGMVINLKCWNAGKFLSSFHSVCELTTETTFNIVVEEKG